MAEGRRVLGKARTARRTHDGHHGMTPNVFVVSYLLIQYNSDAGCSYPLMNGMCRNNSPFGLCGRTRRRKASAGDLASLDQSRTTIATKDPTDQTRLALCLVDAVGQFARGHYADVAESLKTVSADQ